MAVQEQSNVTDDVPVGSLTSVPNLVTLARIVLTLVCFLALTLNWFGIALVLFLLAAGTDWIDGWWARKFNQISQIGRVLDPFADKLLICGVFVYLSASADSGIPAWAAVLVFARELLVTALRSFVEASGGDFSAKWLGKYKMVFQCITAALSLLLLAGWWSWQQDSASLIIQVFLWITVLLTIWSGWGYVTSAYSMAMQSQEPS